MAQYCSQKAPALKLVRILKKKTSSTCLCLTTLTVQFHSYSCRQMRMVYVVSESSVSSKMLIRSTLVALMLPHVFKYSVIWKYCFQRSLESTNDIEFEKRKDHTAKYIGRGRSQSESISVHDKHIESSGKAKNFIFSKQLLPKWIIESNRFLLNFLLPSCCHWKSMLPAM